jgi:hypothetical protein
MEGGLQVSPIIEENVACTDIAGDIQDAAGYVAAYAASLKRRDRARSSWLGCKKVGARCGSLAPAPG